MTTRRQPSVEQFFSPKQLLRAQAIWDEHRHSSALNAMLIESVVDEAKPDIDRMTGQCNDARYLAYLLEASFINGLRIHTPVAH